MKEDKFISCFWRCENCEEILPKEGFIWRKRFTDWLQDMKERDMMNDEVAEVMVRPYYCDGCISLIDKEE